MKTAQQVVLAYVDAFNRGDVDGVCSLFTSDAVVWGVTGWGSPDEARPVWKDLMEALQIQLTVDAMVVQGETVVVRYTDAAPPFAHFEDSVQPTAAKSCSQWSGSN